VELSANDDHIMLVVTDNGIGITREQMSKANSFGLLGMRERVYGWQGEVRIEGNHNRGTAITVIIPKVRERSTG
jgi:signal transduction histidine kinase